MLHVGTVVFDRAHDMVGVVDDVAGPIVMLWRPTGLTWKSRSASVRPGTAYERRQLGAIDALHQQRLKAAAG
ncbi:hypothetical protein ACWCXX_06540 [Streptomyces sp. NPDC001732]